jgi:hypothetical protein
VWRVIASKTISHTISATSYGAALDPVVALDLRPPRPMISLPDLFGRGRLTSHGLGLAKSLRATTTAPTLSQELLVKNLVDGAASNAPALRSYERRLRDSPARSMPKQSIKPNFRARYGRCLFGRGYVANTNANGEHYARSWTRS